MIFRAGNAASVVFPQGRMHFKRLIISIIFVPVLYLYIMYLPPEYFLLLLTFFATIGLAEFHTMCKIKGLMKYSGILWGAVLMFVFFAAEGRFLNILLLAVLTTTGLRLFIKRDARSSISDSSTSVLGLLYVPGLLTFQISLMKAEPAWIILLYASVWAADSMAYYVGKGIGKRKLYEEMSPNKTVAGAVGSVIGGILGAGLIKAVLMQQITIQQAVLIGAAVGSATVIGDLVESMFKRDAGVKDSGNLLPGHGGILDKLDGVTFAGPVLYWSCLGLKLIS